jgi:hypothetical protein
LKVQIERFKLLRNHHLKLCKSSCNSRGNRVIFKNFLRGAKIGYKLKIREFSVKSTPPILKGRNFLTF